MNEPPCRPVVMSALVLSAWCCCLLVFPTVQMSSAPPAESTSRSAEPPLFQDLLEHTFSFLPLSDLAAALAVSRAWAEAVESMPDAQVTITTIPTRLSGPTRLSRHISGLVCGLRDIHVPSLNRALAALPSLRHLDGSISTGLEVTTIQFPVALQVLRLCFSQDVAEADVNCILSGLSAQPLPSLQDVTLDFAWTGHISFEPLRSLPALTSLSCAGFFEPWTRAQLAVMASLPHLLQIDLPSSGMNADELRFFLSCASESQPRWEDLHCTHDISDEVGGILSGIETLTTLQGACNETLRFLEAPRLPNLTRIMLHLSGCASSPAQVLTALQHRSTLVQLELSGCSLNSNQLQSLCTTCLCFKGCSCRGLWRWRIWIGWTRSAAWPHCLSSCFWGSFTTRWMLGTSRRCSNSRVSLC